MRSNKTDLILIQPKNADGMPIECRRNADVFKNQDGTPRPNPPSNINIKGRDHVFKSGGIMCLKVEGSRV